MPDPGSHAGSGSLSDGADTGQGQIDELGSQKSPAAVRRALLLRSEARSTAERGCPAPEIGQGGSVAGAVGAVVSRGR
jgi:hypothetical protein